MFKKKEVIDSSQNIDMVVAEPSNPILSMKDEQKLAIMERIGREISLSMHGDKQESYSRTEEVISPAVTRSIDLYEQDKEGSINPRRAKDGHSWELTGSLGNITTNQMPFFRMANFNAQWAKLRDGIYLDIYELDEKSGMPVLDANGDPKIIKTEMVDIAQLNRDMIANTNLAVNANRAKLHGQTLVGQSGGSPLGVGGSWDDTLNILFGGDQKRKK